MKLGNELSTEIFKDDWYYNVNYLGEADVFSDEVIERHYLFETHGKKIDLLIDSDGELITKNFIELPDSNFAIYKIAHNSKLKRILLDENFIYAQKAKKALLDNGILEEDIDAVLTDDCSICFDKLIVFYNKKSSIVFPYYGVNIIDNQLQLKKVNRSEFLEYINNF